MNGIYFDDTHSYDDLNLVLSSVDIPPAKVKINYVDIPCGDGSVDLTEALGEVKFEDRECKFVFTVFPTDDFEAKKKEVSNFINGSVRWIRLNKDPNYYWEGRCFVDEYKSDKNIHQITITATVSPYKYKCNKTVVTVPSGTSVTRTLPRHSRKTVIPTIKTTADAEIIFGGDTYNVNAGEHKILNIELCFEENEVTVTSTGSTVFTYQEGDL